MQQLSEKASGRLRLGLNTLLAVLFGAFAVLFTATSIFGIATGLYTKMEMIIGFIIIEVLLWVFAAGFFRAARRMRAAQKPGGAEKGQANLFFLGKKACPICSGKLAPCYPPKKDDRFPYLMLAATAGSSAGASYYCPKCREFRPVDGDYPEYHMPQPEPIEAGGVRFTFQRKFIQKQTMIGFALIFVLLAILFLIRKAAAGLSGAASAPVGLIVLALVILSLAFGIQLLKNIMELKKAYYAVAGDGLVFFDGKKQWNYRWEDIQIVGLVPINDGKPVQPVAFATTQQNFVLSENLENMGELLAQILAHLPKSAFVDPRLTKQEASKNTDQPASGPVSLKK